MKTNKNYKITFIFLFVCLANFAQHHDVKVRTLGIIARNFGLSYEYSFKKTIGLNLVYNTTNKRPLMFSNPSDFENTSNYKHYNITPEIRFYFKGEGKGKFTGIYFRYQESTSGKSIPDQNITFDQTFKGMSAGFTYGYKFVQRKGFLIELLFGGGYVFDRKFTFSSDLVIENTDAFSDGTTDEIDPRFSILLGYRF